MEVEILSLEDMLLLDCDKIIVPARTFTIKEIEDFLNQIIKDDFYCHSCGGNQVIHIHKEEFLKRLGETK